MAWTVEWAGIMRSRDGSVLKAGVQKDFSGMRSKPGRCLGSFSEGKPSAASSNLLKSMEEGEKTGCKEVQDARVVGRPGVSKGHREGLSLEV